MLEKERDACLSAARAGGEVLKGFFRRLDPASITEKSRNDLVSEADRASEALIQRRLADAFPSYGFLGEEGGPQGPMGDLHWIVDPLDGTLNFVQGFPHWCVSVALWDAQGPRAGCVYDPLREDVFLAARGMGATWNGQPMHVSAQPGLDGAFLATGFAYQLGTRFTEFNRALTSVFHRAKGIRRAGSAALDLAHTACGIYDGYFEMGLKPWDFAAGVLLVTEAGGRVSDWDGNEGWKTTGDMAVAGAGVHGELVGLLR